LPHIRLHGHGWILRTPLRGSEVRDVRKFMTNVMVCGPSRPHNRFPTRTYNTVVITGISLRSSKVADSSPGQLSTHKKSLPGFFFCSVPQPQRG
jgi:hypothetical protein